MALEERARIRFRFRLSRARAFVSLGKRGEVHTQCASSVGFVKSVDCGPSKSGERFFEGIALPIGKLSPGNFAEGLGKRHLTEPF